MRDEMDILKEMGNTAAAHGSTALSEMLGRRIILNAPTTKIVSSSQLINTLQIDGSTMVLQTQILTGLKNESLFIILDEKSAYKLIDICCKDNQNDKKSIFTEYAVSLIKEIGNVIISAYIGALGYFLRKLIISSLPVLMNAPLADILQIVTAGHDPNKDALVIESIFEEPKEKIKGNIWLVLSPGAADEIIATCKKVLREI